MKDMIYRIFTVDENGEATVHGYQGGEKAQEALDSFLEQHPECIGMELHCVLWSWHWK